MAIIPKHVKQYVMKVECNAVFTVTVKATSQNIQRGTGSPFNNVSMFSVTKLKSGENDFIFLMELKEKYRTCTDCFTTSTTVYWSIYLTISIKLHDGGRYMTTKSSIRHQQPVLHSCSVCLCGQATRKYHTKPCLVKAGHLALNLKENQVVGCKNTMTLQGNWGIHTEEMTLPVLTHNE
jgi:hypothetical protein